MFHVTVDDDDDDAYTHNEDTKGHRTKDDRDEGRLATSLRQYGVFQNKIDTLQNMINKDLPVKLFRSLCLEQNTW